MANDDDELEREERAAILRRRAVFVASAIAGLSGLPACSDARPGPCLEAPVAIPSPPPATATESAAPPDAGPTAEPDADVPPQACLKVAPQPCLEMPPPPPTSSSSTPPKVCLRMIPPKPGSSNNP
ncbi:MAG: hypothetical protein HOW73_02380 [Polyangiaceae bacterium]|nr:hypothetical protein [Polyangiaceae bacterium]